MLKIIKNKIVTGVVASLFIAMSQSAFTFDVNGESFPANFKMRNIYFQQKTKRFLLSL